MPKSDSSYSLVDVVDSPALDGEGGSCEGDACEGACIAVVTMGVKLAGEERGYTRFRSIAETLVRAGFEVDLITTSFQHWEKAQRNCQDPMYAGLPYGVVFIDEPGYTRNLDLARIRSHHVAAENLASYFASVAGRYQLIYCEIPPNDVARVCCETAEAEGIPFVADINDLWPEAMRMVVDVPVVSDVAFAGFERDAHYVYSHLDAAVGTSDEYALRPAAERTEPYLAQTVYVGCDIDVFDEGARERAADAAKPAGERWVTYAGTLGASYDLGTLVRAAALAKTPGLRVKVLGDGPDREALEKLAADLGAPVDFEGYLSYDLMAAYLCASDVVVNSLKASAAQSIVTKIGDYLASGRPLLNTGLSAEFTAKVESDNFGINVEPEDAPLLAAAIDALLADEALCEGLGRNARAIAEAQFDRKHSYQAITRLIRKLL